MKLLKIIFILRNIEKYKRRYTSFTNRYSDNDIFLYKEISKNYIQNDIGIVDSLSAIISLLRDYVKSYFMEKEKFIENHINAIKIVNSIEINDSIIEIIRAYLMIVSDSISSNHELKETQKDKINYVIIRGMMKLNNI
jgi:hypothetical protein